MEELKIKRDRIEMDTKTRWQGAEVCEKQRNGRSKVRQRHKLGWVRMEGKEDNIWGGKDLNRHRGRLGDKWMRTETKRLWIVRSEIEEISDSKVFR